MRTGRIGSTLRGIIADELARIDELSHLTVTEVEVDNELTRAKVFLASFDEGGDDVDLVYEHVGRIRKAIADRARIRRVPDLEFSLDPGLLAGTRVNEILAGMRDDRAFSDEEE